MRSFEVVPWLETSRRVLSNRNAKIKLTCEFEACQENGQVGSWPVCENPVCREPGQADKHRTISSSVVANSLGRRAGNPKHSFPLSMAGSQKQLFSTGKQRKAVTGRSAKAASRPKPVPSDRSVLLRTRSIGWDLTRSEAARLLGAKWHRNFHRRSRSV